MGGLADRLALLALAASATLASAYQAYSLLGPGPLLPGDLAPLEVRALLDRGVLKPHLVLARALEGWLGPLGSLGLVSSLSVAASSASTLLVFRLFSRSLAGAAVALVASVFSPLLYAPHVSGGYGPAFSIALTNLGLSLVLYGLWEGGRLAPLATGSALLVAQSLYYPGGSLLTAPVLLSWVFVGRGPGVSWLVKRSPVLVAAASSLLAAPRGLPPGAWSWGLLDQTLSALVVLLAVASAAGLAHLAYSGGGGRALAMAVWLAAGLLLGLAWGLDPVLRCLPLVYSSLAYSVTLARGSYKLEREEGSLVLELDLARLLPALLGALLLVYVVFEGPPKSESMVAGADLTPEEVRLVTETARVLGGLVEPGSVVVAPPRVSSWLWAFSGLNVLHPGPGAPPGLEEGLDAATSTAFRIRGRFLMVDEWQPLSSTRSPFIYSFDGRVFAEILHLDDGTNRMYIRYSGDEWLEDLHGVVMTGYEFLEGGGRVSLVMRLWKKAFNATKRVTVYTDKPVVEVSYEVRPGKGELVNFSLPVYIEGRHEIEYSVRGRSVVLRMPHVDLRVEYLGGGLVRGPELVRHPVQDRVVAVYRGGGLVNATVRITVLNPRDSGLGPYYFSVFDFVREAGASYLLVYPGPPGLSHVRDALPRVVGALEVVDAFSRVELDLRGVRYVEAPAYARVLGEEVRDGSRVVRYRTAGLLITKSVSATGRSVDLWYRVEAAKEGVELTGFNLTLWVPWERSLSYVRRAGGVLEIGLDAGSLRLRVEVLGGVLEAVEWGPHPEYGQERVLLRFGASGGGAVAGVRVTSGLGLVVEYKPTTRPLMESSDVLAINARVGLLEPVYSDDLVALYRVLWP